MKKLMLGNEAVARGIYESGCKVVSSYPGTPSTEITEFAAEYDEVYAEWAPNEKVAAEVAIGASIQGARSLCAMKHVGLNVAADPVYTASYTGVNGGLVIAVADDPGMHSSQNEQDSRHHAIASKIMCIEPADSSECLNFTKAAFELSEKFDTPVLLRLTTRIAHSRSLVELSERVELPLKDYEKDPSKYVMMPAMAIKRHVVVEQRLKDIAEFSETSDLNRIERVNNPKFGVITSGASYQYSKEVLGECADILKLGILNPLPVKLLTDFIDSYDKVYIIEELDGIIESFCRSNYCGKTEIIGKELFGYLGEFSQDIVAEKVLGIKAENVTFGEEIPPRPPVLCPGCPHRGLFYVLKKLKLTVSGDIGCYTLGTLAPLAAMDTTICMGASVSALHGMEKARGEEFAKHSVAVIGDSTFMHSGMTGLANIAYNKGNSTVIVLDNSITGMTGHQQNPTTGKTLKGDNTVAVNLEKLAEAFGYQNIAVTDPYDLKQTEKVIKEQLEKPGMSLVISRRPCALLKTVKRKPALKIDNEKCKGCKSCMKIGCPAISIKDGKAVIDFTQCVGCGVCKQMCAFDAISE